MAHVSLPLRHPMASARHWLTEAFIPVDEFRRDGALAIRAQAPVPEGHPGEPARIPIGKKQGSGVDR